MPNDPHGKWVRRTRKRDPFFLKPICKKCVRVFKRAVSDHGRPILKCPGCGQITSIPAGG